MRAVHHLGPWLLKALAVSALVAIIGLFASGTAGTQAKPLSEGLSNCSTAGISAAPARRPIPANLNVPGCMYDGPAAQVSLPDNLTARRPLNVFGGLPTPHPGYHHVGIWYTDTTALDRASVHSSKLEGVQTKPGDCFWRTSHLVFWAPDGAAYWVESGEIKCARDRPAIFVYIGGWDGAPGYGFGPNVDEGVLVTTFAEWECVDGTTYVSAGYYNQASQKVYIYRYNTNVSPCVETNQTDNQGEAYVGAGDHFPVKKYTALNAQICQKASGDWQCGLWDTSFPTIVGAKLGSYDVHWFTDAAGNPVRQYHDWFGHGHARKPR